MTEAEEAEEAETEAAITPPTSLIDQGFRLPKYKVGDVVFFPTWNQKDEEMTCPDCLGGKVWNVTTPTGLAFSVPCPRCVQSYHAPTLKRPVFYGVASRLVINRVTISTDRNWRGKGEGPTPTVEYTCNGHSSYQEDQLYADEATALAIGNEHAAKRETEHLERDSNIHKREIPMYRMREALAAEAKIAHAELKKKWDKAICLLGEMASDQEFISGVPSNCVVQCGIHVLTELNEELPEGVHVD